MVIDAMIPYRYRPSPGFLLVCSVYAAVASFFLWGFSRPDLDRIWFIEHELEVGRTSNVDRSDLKLLVRAFSEHPELLRDFLKGGDIRIVSSNTKGVIETERAYVVRALGSEEDVMKITCYGRGGLPLRVSVRAMFAGGSRKLDDIVIDAPGGYEIPLGSSEAVELFEIRPTVSPDRDEGGGGEAALRIGFGTGG
jgi:hypothetical protein